MGTFSWSSDRSFWGIDKIHARQHCSGMKRTLCFVSLAAWLTGGCAWYNIQPISADSLNGWGKTNCLPEGYIFYQPELYFSATIVTESTGSTNKQNVTVTPIWLPNYQKPYRVTTHNILAKADFTFNFENGWKLNSIADKGDNSTVANTLASQLTTVLKTAEEMRLTGTQRSLPKRGSSFTVQNSTTMDISTALSRWMCPYPNKLSGLRVRPIHPLRIEDHPRSASNQDAAGKSKSTLRLDSIAKIAGFV